MRALSRALVFAVLLSSLSSRPAFAIEDQTDIRIEPEHPTSLDPIRVTVTLMSYGSPWLEFLGVTGQSIRFGYYDIIYLDQQPPLEAWTIESTVGPLKPGIYTIDMLESGVTPIFRKTFEVVEPSPGLSLRDAADTVFSVFVDFEPPPHSNLRGTGYGVRLTNESGYFWFFDPGNIEITVKILDGRPVNGRYWVFLSSMTDLKFTATVTHCPKNPQIGAPCFSKTYQSTQGVNRNIVDTDFSGF